MERIVHAVASCWNEQGVDELAGGRGALRSRLGDSEGQVVLMLLARALP